MGLGPGGHQFATPSQELLSTLYREVQEASSGLRIPDDLHSHPGSALWALKAPPSLHLLESHADK